MDNLYNSAIKYAMHILNNEPNYSLDKLKKISEKAYLIAKRYIDDINRSKETVQAILYTGLIIKLTDSFITAQLKGRDLINNASKDKNVNAFLSGVHIIATSEEEYCSKLAVYIPELVPLNLRINQIRLEIDTLDKTKPEPNLTQIETFKFNLNKYDRIRKLVYEMTELRDKRMSLIKKFLERNNI